MAIVETIKGFTKVAGKWIVKYAPQILTTGGVLLMSTAVGTGIMVTPEAKAKLDAIENDQTLSHTDAFKKKAAVIVSNYWPTLALVAGGGALIFCGQHVSLSRLGTATALLATRTDELKKLEQKIIEKDGQKKFDSYKDEIAQEEVQKEAKRQNMDLATVYNTGHGSTLCFDPVGKRFFLSDLEFIRRMRDKFNEAIARDMQHGQESVETLNNWYEMIDLPPLDGIFDDNDKKMGPNIGENLGWRNRMMELRFTCGMLSNDITYTVVGFTDSGSPRWDHDLSDCYGHTFSDDETDMPWR